MKIIVAFFFLFMMCENLAAQVVTISGEKYEEPYSSITHGINLTPDHVNWTLIEQRLPLSLPFPFLNNRFITTGLSLTGANILIENDRYFLSTVPISIENRFNPLRGLSGRAAGDTSAVGQIIRLETDSVLSVEFRNVAMELYNEERDSIWHLDLRFNYRYDVNFREDRVRIHFGETKMGPSAEEQIEDLLIFSATALGIYSEGSTFMFADGDPKSPGFNFIIDEQPDYGFYTLQSIPKEGTVFEYSFATTTSNTPQISGQTVEVFPTPGRNYFLLDFGSAPFSYSVWDLSGQLMTSGTSQAEESVRVETHHWPAGVYIISVEHEEESVQESWIKM